MKKSLATLFIVFLYWSSFAQDVNTMTGDWIRVKAEYTDGGKVPGNHHSRAYVRYHFNKKEMYQVVSASSNPSVYSRTSNVLKIEPIQVFTIEQYDDKMLTLIDAGDSPPIRYYMIPTDSFQTTRKYASEVISGDTVYAIAPGIEPIYMKGQIEFMNSITAGFSQLTAAFDFTYVVQKDGTIGDVVITKSSNPKWDKRLTQLVKKSSGKWIPATYRGKPINVKVKDGFSLRSR